MKINNAQISGSYAEISQTNPLRWTNLFREADGSFTRQSFKWKCKDFLNEVVRKYQGQTSSIYGYSTAGMKENEEGVWLLLEHIVDIPKFMANLGSINSRLAEAGMEPIEILNEPEGFVIRLPREVLTNTWSTSWVTYFIRVSNVDTVIEDFRKHPTKGVDNPFEQYFDKAWKMGPKNPKPGFWYYSGEKYSPQDKPNTHVVHDCGVHTWMRSLTMDGFFKEKAVA